MDLQPFGVSGESVCMSFRHQVKRLPHILVHELASQAAAATGYRPKLPVEPRSAISRERGELRGSGADTLIQPAHSASRFDFVKARSRYTLDSLNSGRVKEPMNSGPLVRGDVRMSQPGTLAAALAFVPNWWQETTDPFALDSLLADWSQGVRMAGVRGRAAR